MWKADDSRIACCYFRCVLSRVQLFETLWTVAHQAPLSMGFSRHEYWSGLLFPSPEDLPDPGTEPGSSALQADSLLSEPPGRPCERDKLRQRGKAEGFLFLWVCGRGSSRCICPVQCPQAGGTRGLQANPAYSSFLASCWPWGEGR